MTISPLVVWISGAVLVIIGLVFFYLWFSQRSDAHHGARMRKQVTKSLKEMGCKIKRSDGKVHCKERGGIQGLGEKFSLNAAVAQAIDRFSILMQGRSDEEMLMRDEEIMLNRQRREAELAQQQQQQQQQMQRSNFDPASTTEGFAFGRAAMPTVSTSQFVPGTQPPVPPLPMTYPTSVTQVSPDHQLQPHLTPSTGQLEQQGFAPGVFSNNNNNSVQPAVAGGGSGNIQPLPFEPIRTKADRTSGGDTSNPAMLKYDPKVF